MQSQLAKNEQSIKEVPSESVSLKGLHTRLQEIQVQLQAACLTYQLHPKVTPVVLNHSTPSFPVLEAGDRVSLV